MYAGQVKVRLAAVVAVLALVAALVPAGAGAASSLRAVKKRTRLVSFDSCAALVHYARRHASQVGPYYTAGDVGGVAGPPAPPTPAPPTGTTGTTAPQSAPGTTGDTAVPGDTSQTNVQEQGVDEPDIVKTDGKTIFALENGRLNAVDARASETRLLSSLELDGYGQDMLLHGDRLLVIGYTDFGTAAGGILTPYWRGGTLLTEIDVSDPTAMKVVRTQSIAGDYRAARLNGDTARVVTTSYPSALYPGAPETIDHQAAGWLPTSVLERKDSGTRTARRLVSCRGVKRPRVFSGLDMLTVLTIDMSKGLPAVDSDALMTSADTVYASPGSLYVATQKWEPPAGPQTAPPPATTAVHRFDITDPENTVYRASGELPGYLMSQWSLSEYGGVLRAATTDSPAWWEGKQVGESQSYVTTLREQGGALVEQGRVGGLGKGERIYAVRFIDDVGFVVTFRQVDPLYTIDLSAPASPRVLGELKIAGYSAYLHPVAKDLLLGVGQDASDAGLLRGTQLSLFDVSDLAHPRRVAKRALAPGSSSAAEWDHHAFLYWPGSKLAVIPVSLYGQDDPFVGAIGFSVDPASGIDEAGRISHPAGQYYTPAIDRSVVVGDRLFTISAGGIAANDIGSFGPLEFVSFPQPAESPYAGGPATAPGSAVRP
ncbi:MAG: hypothetical protein QOJ07_1289 [Thermoleophilaceae bacterium]|nr:hypothetical protein [Thermoleophilaceae bacterium]